MCVCVEEVRDKFEFIESDPPLGLRLAIRLMGAQALPGEYRGEDRLGCASTRKK